MTSWAEFAGAEPDFAARVKAIFDLQKHKTMATLRKDGSPRISGTEIEFSGDELMVGSMPGAVKAFDLQRDPRLAIHGPAIDPPDGNPTLWVGDAKIAGRAVPASGEMPGAHYFRVDITEVVLTKVGDPPDHLVIESWHPDRGYRRVQRE
ncbi:MAG: pyridoxamine 5'-phosphate oxidase family protein [Acidimicrobiales bacterium]